MYRALRPDKVILAALEGTIDDWLCHRHVPLAKMASSSADALKAEVTKWQSVLDAQGIASEVHTHSSTMGGGSLPGSEIPSHALVIRHSKLGRLNQALRRGTPPIIGRVQDDSLWLDARTIVPLGQSEALLAGIKSAFKAVGG